MVSTQIWTKSIKVDYINPQGKSKQKTHTVNIMKNKENNDIWIQRINGKDYSAINKANYKEVIQLEQEALKKLDTIKEGKDTDTESDKLHEENKQLQRQINELKSLIKGKGKK